MQGSQHGCGPLTLPISLFTTVLLHMRHPPRPRVTHVLGEQGLGDLGHDTDGIPGALAVDEDDSSQPAGQPGRASPKQLPLGDGHTSAGQDLHHPWGRGGGVSIRAEVAPVTQVITVLLRPGYKGRGGRGAGPGNAQVEGRVTEGLPPCL